MVYKTGIIALFCLFTACDYFVVSPKSMEKNKIVATVYNASLLHEDIAGLLPEKVSVQDSLVLVKSLINSWAVQQLFLKKAAENSTNVQQQEMMELVTKYRQSLLINSYKERLIQQQLDTVVAEEELHSYYENNKQNFRLNEVLLQLKYIHYGHDFLDKKAVIKAFKSSKEEALTSLEDQGINFKSYHLNDNTWLSLEVVLEKVPPFRTKPIKKLLKISKFIQEKDSLGLYLVAIKKVLHRNDIAPLSYITGTVKQMVLHKRKLELIREIEKTLINDAIQNKHFKEY